MSGKAGEQASPRPPQQERERFERGGIGMKRLPSEKDLHIAKPMHRDANNEPYTTQCHDHFPTDSRA